MITDSNQIREKRETEATPRLSGYAAQSGSTQLDGEEKRNL